jgi:hypothetical protein
MKLTSKQIAEIINSVTSRIPRPDGSFPPDLWCDLSSEQKQRAMDAVVKIYSEPTKTPEELHNLWMKPLLEDGWSAGDFSLQNKKHPCIVPFHDLPASEILKDEIWSSMTELFRPYYTQCEDEASELC